MKFFKNIWNFVRSLFIKRTPTEEEIISDAKKVLETAINTEALIVQIKESENPQLKEDLVNKLVDQMVAEEIIQYSEKQIENSVDIKKGHKKLYEYHELKEEFQKLEKHKALLILAESKIQPISYPDTSSFDSRIDKLFSLLSKNKIDDKVELSDFTVSAFDKDFKQLEKLLQEKSTLKRHGNREREKKKQHEIYESNIKKELNNLDSLIGKNKLDDAKLLINRLSKSLKPDYRKGIERLAKATEKLKEKELDVFRKRQAELLKQQQEEAEKIRIQEELKREEKRKQNLINNLEFEFNSEKDATLENYKIEYVFHMTEVLNLKNIIQHGLLSHNEAHSKGLNKTDIALQDVNQRRANKRPIYGISLHDYVPMYFNPKNPMLYRRKQIQDNIVILAIDRRVIYQDKSIFSDGNAASDSTKFFNNLSDLVRLNWHCIKNEYWNDHVDGKRIKCAETLTHPRIPIKYVKKIHCNSIQTKNIVDKIVPAEKPYRVELNSKYFFSR